MKHAAQQGDIENTRTKAASELLPLLARNEQRAPISLLTPAKLTALIQCFDNNGLYKQKGCWHGSSDSKPISGGTVAVELEANVRYYQDRTERAEKWMYQISSEIQQRLLGGDDTDSARRMTERLQQAQSNTPATPSFLRRLATAGVRFSD